MQNLLFPEDRPVLTADGLEPPRGRFIRVDQAEEYGLSLQEWGTLYFEGIRNIGGTKKQLDELRKFFCGSSTTQWRTKQGLKDRGLL